LPNGVLLANPTADAVDSDKDLTLLESKRLIAFLSTKGVYNYSRVLFIKVI
jgi:hypothetical protein